MWVGEILWTLRAAIGDFAIIDASPYITNVVENHLFWLSFLFVVFFSCVIFLNFIVAEASNSYIIVSEKIDEVI